ncbi:rhomboid family intramembrane serine protease [Kitasatospora sp. NPDC047058]|uniref:rhomboid family intramembrane serine protease n=1 Tax=Kitasatospora sp. NPDC047058 TaxID=3155620 RepID=UPI00340AF611
MIRLGPPPVREPAAVQEAGEPCPLPGRPAATGIAARLRAAPLTLTLLALLWAVGGASGSLAHGPSRELLAEVGIGLPTLAEGRWWTPFTSLLWCPGVGSYVFTSVLLLLFGVPAERRFGWVRMLCVLVVGQVLGTLLGTGLVALGSRAGEQWTAAVADQTATGPVTGLFALAGVLGFRLTVLWRRRLHLLVCVPARM